MEIKRRETNADGERLMLTQEQVDAAMEAQDGDAAHKGKTIQQVADDLAARGHPAFASSLEAPSSAFAVGAPASLEVAGALSVIQPAPAELAPQAPPLGSLDGMDAIGVDDTKVPRLKMKQPMTEDKDNIGIDSLPNGSLFHDNDITHASSTRRIVFLGVRKRRALSVPKNDDQVDTWRAEIRNKVGVSIPADEGGTVCQSPDRWRPVGVGDYPVMSAVCSVPVGRRSKAVCPFAQWRAGRRPPLCGESFEFLVVDVTAVENAPLDAIAIMSLRGSAIRPVKKLLTALGIQMAREAKAYGARVPMCAFEVEMSTFRVDKPHKHWVPKFTRPALIEDDGGRIPEYEGMLDAVWGGSDAQ